MSTTTAETRPIKTDAGNGSNGICRVIDSSLSPSESLDAKHWHALMPVRSKSFTVLMFLDRDLYGYDEHTLPPLIALMDSALPDHRAWSHTGPIGYFLTSRSSGDRIRRVIEQAESLRSSDSRFARLGIGLAEGSMIAQFTWLGRLKPQIRPIGSAPMAAYRCAETDNYRDALQSLQ